MWYKFIKAIYEAIDEADVNNIINSPEAYEKAVELIRNINASNVFRALGYEGRVHIPINDFRIAIRNNLRYYVQNKGNSEEKLKEHFENAGKITKRQCYFAYFYIIENYKLRVDNKDFYKSLLDAAGIFYSPTIFSDMEETIMYFILNSKQHSEIWIGLIQNWAEVNPDYSKDLDAPVVGENNLRTLTYNKLVELINDGYSDEENQKMTRKSLSIIKRNIDEVPSEILGSNKISEVFTENTIKLVLDAETRRQWYLLNIIKLIVEKQIDALVTAYKERNKEKFEFVKSIMWIDRDINDNREDIAVKESWKNVTIDRGYTAEEIRWALKESRIIPADITRWLGRMVDPDSLVDYIVPERRTDNNKVIRDEDEFIRSFIFEGEEYIRSRHPIDNENGEYEEFDDDEILERLHNARIGETRVRAILTVERKNITRELLLLVVLAAKLYGEDTITMDYVTENILYNSRYEDELNPNRNRFDLYFETVFDSIEGEALTHDDFINRMKVIHEESDKLEYYYWKRGISVFNNILHGKAI